MIKKRTSNSKSSMSIDEYRRLTKSQGRSKYNNVKTLYNGVLYDSKKEAERARELDLLVSIGKVTELQRQVKIPLMVGDKKIGNYIADFVYYDNYLSKKVIEDVKGVQTAVFKLKKKILEANGYIITIT